MTNTTTIINTLSTVRASYDRAEIMRRAWAIRREAAAEMGCKVSDVLMSECLHMAWCHMDSEHAPELSAGLVAEWAALSESAQMRFMTACVRRAAKNDIGYSVEDKYLQFTEVPAYALRGHQFDEFVNETWIRITVKLADTDKLASINRDRAERGKDPLTLAKVVYDAAHASISAIFYADVKHGVAPVRTVKDDDGSEYSYIETMCSSARDNTETSATIRVIVEQVLARFDSTSRKIWAYNVLGLTEREIAPYVGISNVAVHKRIVKMREALQKAMAA